LWRPRDKLIAIFNPHGQNAGSGSGMEPMRIHNNAEKRRPAGLVQNKKKHTTRKVRERKKDKTIN
jgi:hypothetical protein